MMGFKEEKGVIKKINQLIERLAHWQKQERKGERSDYQHWFELTGIIEALEWVLGRRKEFYDYELTGKKEVVSVEGKKVCSKCKKDISNQNNYYFGECTNCFNEL